MFRHFLSVACMDTDPEHERKSMSSSPTALMQLVYLGINVLSSVSRSIVVYSTRHAQVVSHVPLMRYENPIRGTLFINLLFRRRSISIRSRPHAFFRRTLPKSDVRVVRDDPSPVPKESLDARGRVGPARGSVSSSSEAIASSLPITVPLTCWSI